ncbi:MAG: hypothetical protein WBQ44_18190 [Rhodococcus sp. (in: high G+C Gram-positive bacteria)]
MSEHSSAIAAGYPGWMVYWPFPLRPGMVLLVSMVFSGGAVGLGAFFVCMRSGEWVGAFGGLATSVALLALCAATRDVTGLKGSRVPRSVVTVRGDERRGGLLLRCKSIRLTALSFSMFAMWGFLAAAVQFSDNHESMLRRRHDSDVGGWVVLGMGVFLIGVVVLMAFRTKADVGLHIAGISRTARRYRFFGWRYEEDFLRWEDVDELRVDAFYVHTDYISVMNPVIRVVSRTLDPSRKLQRLDTEDSLALSPFQLGADPNALMALMRWCHENPEVREHLVHQDARRLLHAPPLRERLRRSREAVKSSK